MDPVREDEWFQTPCTFHPSGSFYSSIDEHRQEDDSGQGGDLPPGGDLFRPQVETAGSSRNNFHDDIVSIQEEAKNVSKQEQRLLQKQKHREQYKKQQEDESQEQKIERCTTVGNGMSPSSQYRSSPTTKIKSKMNDINNDNKLTTGYNDIAAGEDGRRLMSRSRQDTNYNFETQSRITNDEHEEAREGMRKQSQQQQQHLWRIRRSHPLYSQTLGSGQVVTTSQRLAHRNSQEVSPSYRNRRSYGSLNDSDMDSHVSGSDERNRSFERNKTLDRHSRRQVLSRSQSQRHIPSQKHRSSRHDIHSPHLQIQERQFRCDSDAIDVKSDVSFDTNNEMNDERASLLTITASEISMVGSSSSQLYEPPPTLYSRRWYILFLFSMTSLMQGLAFATFGPIAQSTKAVLGWSNSDIALLGVVGNLTACLGSIPFSWIIENKGLRQSMVLGLFFLTAGMGMRCVTLYPPWASWTMNIASIFIAFGNIVSCGSVSLLSSKWFPAYQRTTATTIAIMAGNVGSAVGFIVGPQVVPESPSSSPHHGRHTQIWNETNFPVDGQIVGDQYNDTNVETQRIGMSHFLHTEAGICAFIFLLMLIYFPAQPPTPPSKTARLERLGLKQGVKRLCRNRVFLLVLLAYSCGPTFYNNVTVVLDMDVKRLGVLQKTAGWLGFYGLIAACLSGLVFSRLLDRFPRQLKRVLVILLAISTAFMFWFLLLEGKFIHFDRLSLYLTTIVPAMINCSVIPLFYELACEASYPTGEGVTTLTVSVSCNVMSAIFMAVFLIPNIGVMWINYVFLGTMAVSVSILSLTRISYNRYNLDAMEIDVPPAPSTPHSNQPSKPSSSPSSSSLSLSTSSFAAAAWLDYHHQQRLSHNGLTVTVDVRSSSLKTPLLKHHK